MTKNEIIMLLIAIAAIISPFLIYYISKFLKEIGGLKW